MKTKKPYLILILSLTVAILTSCGNTQKVVTGEFHFYDIQPYNDDCLRFNGTEGIIKSGSGEVLGTVKLSKSKVEGLEKSGLSKCVANLITSPINLSRDVLVFEFQGDARIEGKWILTKEEFQDGVINLRV